jgi:rubrerythrin
MTTSPPNAASWAFAAQEEREHWQPPTKLECLRCGGWFITRELNPRCPYCGHRETPDD